MGLPSPLLALSSANVACLRPVGAVPAAAASSPEGVRFGGEDKRESGNSLRSVRFSFSCIALKLPSGTITHVDRRVLKWFDDMSEARQSKTKRRVV